MTPNLEQWKAYKSEVETYNSEKWKETNKVNEQWTEEWRKKVEQWKLKQDRWGLPPAPPGYCVPVLRHATFEGFLDWLVKEDEAEKLPPPLTVTPTP